MSDAEICYRRVLALRSDHADALHLLGVIAHQAHRHEAAANLIAQAVQRQPRNPLYLYNLGNALKGQGKLEEAISAYRRAIRFKPDAAEAHYNLGNALKDQGKLDEAIAAYRHTIRFKPDAADAFSNLGLALQEQGKLDEAAAACRRAISINPAAGAVAHSNLLLGLNYDDNATADRIFAAHREWNEQYARRVSARADHANERDAERRLRIGYVSPDFRAHSVAFFFEPLLRAHDRQAVEVFCYAEVRRPDPVTARLQGFADHWLTTVSLSDDELARRIAAERIDILVDLAGHTANNRLRLFARRPAPVQVTWLGYPNTTGLDAIDYRLVDSVTDPVGEADLRASETLVRLDGGFLCYGAPKDMPEPGVPPCLKGGGVTFGSFNSPAKLSSATLAAWALLLARLPQSRLLLKGRSLADAGTRASLLSRLAERGVAGERIELAAWSPGMAAHLSLYDRMDIALDPFPYNGTTTTCEALWMGTPVVTLRGDRHAGRVGASLLAQIGLTEFAADSVEDYVEIAAALAASPERLAELRRTLRPRLAASPLCDERSFAGKVERAYRTMWQRWCERR